MDFFAPLSWLAEVLAITPSRRGFSCLPQLGNQFLGQPIGKILLLCVAAEIFERQHSEHFSRVHLRGGLGLSDRRDKAVTAARQRFDEARILR